VFDSGLGRRLFPIALLFAASGPYGACFSMNRFAAEEGVPFLPYVFLYTAFGTVLLLALCAVRREWPRLTPRHIGVYCSIGLFGLALPYCIFMLVADRLPAGLVSIGLTLAPLLTYFWAMLLRLDRFNVIRVGGIVTGIAAVLLILVPQGALSEGADPLWVLFALLGPLSFSLAAIGAAWFQPAEVTALEVGTGVMVAGTLMLVPVLLGVGDWWFFPQGLTLGGWAVIVSALINAYFFVLFQIIIRLAGPVVFSSNNFVTTLSAVVWGMIIFGERHSAYVWGAIALMCLGLFLVTRPTGARRAAPARTAP
jgi:drug/metabolite transporter (DMT)-like permease